MKQVLPIVITLFLLTSLASFAQLANIDSLRQLLASDTADTIRIDVMIEMAARYSNINPEKAIEYGKKAFAVAEKIGDDRRKARSAGMIGSGFLALGDLSKTIEYWQQRYQFALRSGDRNILAGALNGIGRIYNEIGSYELGRDYYRKAFVLYQQTGNKRDLAVTYNYLGESHLMLGSEDSVMFFFREGLDLAKKHHPRMLSTLHSNLADLLYRQKQYDSALVYVAQGKAYAKEYNNERVHSILCRIAASLELARNNYGAAEAAAREALQISQATDIKLELYKAYDMLSQVAAARKNFTQAYQFGRQAQEYKDRLQSQTTKNALEVFEYERKQGEIAVLKAQKAQQAAEFERREQQQKWVMFSSLAGLVSLSFFSLFIYQNRKKEQQSAMLLRQKNTDLTLAQDLLQKKNDDITASIQYARRIQTAMLPSPARLAAALPQHFVFWQPRDIVSGDFYWLAQHGGKTLVAAVDCTGHGVPGAFMSMIGSELLNQIVNVQGITSPELVLQNLHQGIGAALSQHESNISDGMDMALCTIDHAKQQLEYAGAMNPLYYVQGGILHEIKADKLPIGGMGRDKGQHHFQKHSLHFAPGDTFYLCSDGFQDQFGGQQGRKFMVKNFRELLHGIAHLPMHQQQAALHTAFAQWKADRPQVDDVLVMGFRI